MTSSSSSFNHNTTPQKGIFGRALGGLFGPATPPTNEPTIDYTRFTSQGSGRRSSDYESTINSTREFRPSKPYRDLFEDKRWLDDDRDIRRDLDAVYNNHDDTVMRLEMLPYNYPGSFPSTSNRDVNTTFARSSSRDGTRLGERERDVFGIPIHGSADRSQIRGRNYESVAVDREQRNRSRSRSYTDNNYPKYPYTGADVVGGGSAAAAAGTAPASATSLSTELKLAKINASLQSISSTYDVEKLGKLVQAVDERNEFLNELNQLVELSAKEELQAPSAEVYNKLYSEYNEELVKCNRFYEAYYKLAFKYGELKKKLQIEGAAEADPGENTNDAASKTLGDDIAAIIENVKFIQAISVNSSILSKCETIVLKLTDYKGKIDRQQRHEQTLEEENKNLQARCTYYQDELAKAKLRILELERGE